MSWYLKSLATQQLVRESHEENNRENMGVLHYWLFVRGIHLGNSLAITRFPSQRVSQVECVSMSWHPQDQCWKFPQVRRSEADNFGGGPETFSWFFFNFMFMIWDSKHEDLQLFWLSFKHCSWCHHDIAGSAFNSSPPGQNGGQLARRHFQIHFLEWKW